MRPAPEGAGVPKTKQTREKMGYYKDLGSEIIDRWENGIPYDEYGHALDGQTEFRGFALNENSKEAWNLTSPYGHLDYALGSADDFVCFDWNVLPDGRIIIHAVVNSETGSFIQDFAYEIASPEDAIRVAENIIDDAYGWCYDNEIKIDKKGWIMPEKMVDVIRKHLNPKQTDTKEKT